MVETGEYVPTPEQEKIDFAVDALLRVKANVTGGINAMGVNLLLDREINRLYEVADNGV